MKITTTQESDIRTAIVTEMTCLTRTFSNSTPRQASREHVTAILHDTGLRELEMYPEFTSLCPGW